MLKILLATIFKGYKLYAKPSAIRGTHSSGRMDRGNVWWPS